MPATTPAEPGQAVVAVGFTDADLRLHYIAPQYSKPPSQMTMGEKIQAVRGLFSAPALVGYPRINFRRKSDRPFWYTRQVRFDDISKS